MFLKKKELSMYGNILIVGKEISRFVRLNFIILQ